MRVYYQGGGLLDTYEGNIEIISFGDSKCVFMLDGNKIQILNAVVIIEPAEEENHND